MLVTQSSSRRAPDLPATGSDARLPHVTHCHPFRVTATPQDTQARAGARLLRRVPLQPPRDRAGLDHEPPAHRRAGAARRCSPGTARRRGARRRADRRQRGRRHRACTARRAARCVPPGAAITSRSKRSSSPAIAATQRGISLCQSLLRAQLGQRVNVMILEKALTLELQQFEDSEFYDKLTRARREASSRPLSLVMRTFGLAQNGVSLVSYAALLVQFSPWAVVVLLLAGLPAFVAEAKFSGDAFRLFRWRSPETRMQMYLETVLAREDHAKEVKLFELGAAAARPLPRHLRAALRGRSRPHHPARQLGLRAGSRSARPRSTAATPGSRSRR